MKTTYTIAAIAMFAVIMGMSAIAPAMADHKKTDPNNDRSNARTLVCHLFEEETDEEGVTTDAHYDGLLTNNNGATNGHLDHGDKLIGVGVDEILLDLCRALDPALPIP